MGTHTEVGAVQGSDRIREVAWQLWRVHMQATKRIAVRLEAMGLHVGLPRLMHYIKQHPGASQSEVARHMMVTDPAITHSIKRLVKGGLIETTYDPEDQRRKRMRLTDEGIRTLARCDAALAEVHEELFQGVTEGDLGQLGRILNQLETTFSEEA